MLQLIPADGDVLAQILGQTHRIWADRMEPPAFERFNRAQLNTPWGRRRLRRVALVDDATVLASTKVYTFTATLDGRTIEVCGLGAVFTQTAHRGEGHATALIARVLAQAEAEGQQLALLFSEIGTEFYARQGFVHVPTHDQRFEVAAPPTGRGAPATLVRFGDDRDLETIAGLGETRAAPFRFHLNRDRALVHYAIAKQRLRAGLAPAGARELQFFVAEEGTTAAAYVVMAVEDGRWTLLECGDRDPTGARIGAMLQVLIARDPAAGPPTIIGRLPPGLLPSQMRVLDTIEPFETMMVRPLGGTALPRLDESDVLYWRSDLF